MTDRLAWDAWIEQARRDLRAARHVEEGGFPEWTVYLSRQAAEKAAKAYWVALGFPHQSTHDLKALVGPWSEVAPESPDLAMAFATLTQYSKGERDRYPTPVDDKVLRLPSDYINATDAKHCLDAATRLVEFCEVLVRRAVTFRDQIGNVAPEA